MIVNYNNLCDLYNETISLITSSPQEWQRFLRCASNNYKLRFDEQVLVFAQRPDATAVLEMNRWNKSFGRWVNKGSTGIPVFVNKDRTSKRLIHYFDISDTHESSNSRPVPIWNMKPEYENDIIETLEGTFGDLENKDTLAHAVLSSVNIAIEDNIDSYLEEFELLRADTEIGDLSPDEAKALYIKLATNSVAYMILSRLNIEPSGVLDKNAFDSIIRVKGDSLINSLGIVSGDISKITLQEIAKTVLSLEKTITENKIHKNRSVENENHKYTDRRLQLSEPDSTTRPEHKVGTVRSDERELSEGTQESDIYDNADQRNSGRTSAGNRAQSAGDDRQADRTDESREEHHGGAQELKSDVVGSGDEQHSKRGTRDSILRSDLRLEVYDKDGSSNRPYVVVDEKINEILSTTPHLKVSHRDIVDFFNNEKDTEKRAEFIKSAINNDFTVLQLNDTTFGYKSYDNGLLLWRGDYLTRDAETFMSWESLTDHFDAMILLNQIKSVQNTLLTDNDVEYNPKTRLEFTGAFIDRYLQTRHSDTKFGIYEQFQKSFSNKDNADYLKSMYGLSGRTHSLVGSGVGYNSSPKGLSFYSGYRDDEIEKLISWNDIAKRLDNLIKQDNYLTEKEMLEYPAWLEMKEQQRAEYEQQKRNLEILSIAPETLETPKIDYDYEYHLGDTVYLGNDEHQILSFDDNRVLLYDTNYPLFNKELKFEEFEKKVKENPLNDHLKVNRLSDDDLIGKELEIDGHRFVIERLSKLSKDVSMRDVTLADRGVPVNRVEKLDYVRSLLRQQNIDSNTTFVTETEAVNPADQTQNDVDEQKKENSLSFSIGFSEHPAFYDKELNDRYNDISFALGNKLLGVLDEKQHRERKTNENVGWYHKTDFEIKAVVDGEDFTYTGRFDVGDGEGDIITHIKNHCNYCLSPDCIYTSLWKKEGEEYYQEQIDGYNNVLNVLIPFLEKNSELSQEDNTLFDEIMSLESEWFPDYNSMEQAQSEVVETDTPSVSALEQFTEQWNKYSQIKEKHADSMVLYQVGDFFEILGNDAVKFSELTGAEVVSRRISEKHTVAMCGIPSFTLEENVELIRGNGHSIILASQENGELVLRGMEAKEPVEKSYESKTKTNELKPTFEQTTKANIVQPNIPLSDRHNFELSSNAVEIVSKKERYCRNVKAINVLKECEFENRLATPEEQIILSKYVGWGGIPEAFDENISSWSNEFKELYTTLSPEEYSSARESTLTAFFTPPEVIEAIYQTLSNLGFNKGNILEPSCGTGNFIGMLPESMRDSKVYGVELDSISAKIAQQLYQKASIANQGFEKTQLPDNFFDAVVGNVPFGDFKVVDKKFDKHNFLIHDYFFAKSLDKLRPGGVMALITSSGTMDKKKSDVRKYIAQRADLLGAIRLPNSVFGGNAGTDVVSDILILQKKERVFESDANWLNIKTDENGYELNEYFVDHPEMVLGELKTVSGRFGPELSCLPKTGATLKEQLSQAIANIVGYYKEVEVDNELENESADEVLPADPDVRNFSFTLVGDKVYYRENSIMTPVETSATALQRIKGMIEIRDSVRKLIELQTDNAPDAEIKAEQDVLNKLYDKYTKKYDIICSRGNKLAFQKDTSYPLLASLEILDENGKLLRKADMFTKRTITPHVPVTSVDTSNEALVVSLGEKAGIDIEYMKELSGKTEEELFDDLQGVIFLNPLYGYGNATEPKYLMADEYLSGNVREKLAWAKKSAELYPETYSVNVAALEKVQPEDLSASEISVRLGSTWIPTEVVTEFMFDLLETNKYLRGGIDVKYSKYTGEWRIEGKNRDSYNVKANTAYGTSRVNAYHIIENTLNLVDVRVFDYETTPDGKKKAILNKKETALAQAKQEQIKQAFADWIWQAPERRERLTKMYNEMFNSLRPREYDGSNINFVGMNPEIKLREHQRNAVAHILYGGNTLLAHAVGAGKTYEMVAAAKELKRLGLCSKPMFVVPNHLTEQWGAEFLQLYPASNILVATKKDFERKNRQKFCARIATGDYDAVIIGHSQFEKIPMSYEYQKQTIESQIAEILDELAELKHKAGNRFTVKQLEKTKKSLTNKLEKLNDTSRKDQLVTFEELGVDRLFIDESHYYKNLYMFSKMHNVGGIAQTEAQKASDLFMKCRYLDNMTGGKGVVFATGTPISNSMVELYTIQRYLQYNTLVKHNLQHFDSWASTFGETVSSIELTPEGKGYRSKTRFAKFYNLPELMSMFKEVADIKTADTLDLPVPKATYTNVAVKPSAFQKDIVNSLAERAEKIRGGGVDSSKDNMLKITNDGRNLALDQRLINDTLPDFEGSKVNACVDNIYRIWNNTKEQRSTQLVFSDLATPKDDGRFSVYNDIKAKLVNLGVPESEVDFIHNAKTDAQKQQLFQKVRNGDVRVLLGSTQKMGAGTNVQDRLIALHDLDCPWRPADLEQRSGRILRQGNQNDEVFIYRYVTEETFDAYLYQLVEGKQKFASQIMTSKSPARTAEDIDSTALSYAEIKMLATGNPYIKEKMDLDIQVQKLRLLKSNHLSVKYSLEDKILKYYPQRIALLTNKVNGLEEDLATVKSNPRSRTEKDEAISMIINGVEYKDRNSAGQAIIDACRGMKSSEPVPLGTYRGFDLELRFAVFYRQYIVQIKGKTSTEVELSSGSVGNVIRIDNAIDKCAERLAETRASLQDTLAQFENAKLEVQKPFAHEDELASKTERLNELNALLNVDEKVIEVADDETEPTEPQKENNKEQTR